MFYVAIGRESVTCETRAGELWAELIGLRNALNIPEDKWPKEGIREEILTHEPHDLLMVNVEDANDVLFKTGVITNPNTLYNAFSRMYMRMGKVTGDFTPINIPAPNGIGTVYAYLWEGSCHGNAYGLYMPIYSLAACCDMKAKDVHARTKKDIPTAKYGVLAMYPITTLPYILGLTGKRMMEDLYSAVRPKVGMDDVLIARVDRQEVRCKHIYQKWYVYFADVVNLVKGCKADYDLGLWSVPSTEIPFIHINGDAYARVADVQKILVRKDDEKLRRLMLTLASRGVRGYKHECEKQWEADNTPEKKFERYLKAWAVKPDTAEMKRLEDGILDYLDEVQRRRAEEDEEDEDETD